MMRPTLARTSAGLAGAAAAGVVAAAAVAAGALAGAWYAPFLLGLAGGLILRASRWRTAVACGAVAMLGWVAPLGWDAVRGAPVGAVARTVAALAGLPPYAAVALTATMLVALVQALAGAWLGWAARSLAPRAGGAPGHQHVPDARLTSARPASTAPASVE